MSCMISSLDGMLRAHRSDVPETVIVDSWVVRALP
jgi:hypothetical protein